MSISTRARSLTLGCLAGVASGALLVGCAVGAGQAEDARGTSSSLGEIGGGIIVKLPPPVELPPIRLPPVHLPPSEGSPPPEDVITDVFKVSLAQTLVSGDVSPPNACNLSYPYKSIGFDNNPFIQDLQTWGCLGVLPVVPNPALPDNWWMLTLCPNARAVTGGAQWAFENVAGGVAAYTMQTQSTPDTACSLVGSGASSFWWCAGEHRVALGGEPPNNAGDLNPSPKGLLWLPPITGIVAKPTTALESFLTHFVNLAPYNVQVRSVLRDCGMVEPAPQGWSFVYFDPKCPGGSCVAPQ